MKPSTLSRDDWFIIAALVLFALFFRVSTLMMIHTGVDERDYWQSAKAIARSLPYPELSHRTTRYGVILPVALAQIVLGSHPNVYYLMPVLNCMAQALLAYLIGLRLRGKITGFLAALALVLFPYMIRAGSQVRPEVFSITYILLALWCFIEYLDGDRSGIRPLLWMAFWIFVAYETKITNLFFVPGFLLAIVVCRKRPGHALLLGGVLLGMFLAETGLYAILTEYRFGELEIILQKHFRSDSFSVPHVWDLFRRFSPRYLQAYWSIPFAAFAGFSVFFLVKRTDRKVKGLILGTLSFFLFLTIAVKSLHPVTPVEAFINRYFSAVLAPVFLVLAHGIEDLAARFGIGTRKLPSLATARPFVAFLGAMAVLVAVLFSLPGLPSGIREYVHSPFNPGEHPLVLNETFRREINRAYRDGVPVVASGRGGGSGAIMTATSYYLDLAAYEKGRPPAARDVVLDGLAYRMLARPGASGVAGEYLAVIRLPFRMAKIPASELPGLTGDSFDGTGARTDDEPDDEPDDE
ncbi:MAG: glycosyltransferase family 39 protein [Spirochaetes bacterium]|nr:glycosyltransferase family 39 protein [Spirochaetota bacterium]